MAFMEEDSRCLSQKAYTVLEVSDIRRRMDDFIAQLSAVLSISKNEASIFLTRYGWNDDKVYNAWFDDEREAREKAGLFEKPTIELHDTGDVTCSICFESFPLERILSLSCGHPYCANCWRTYISASINDGLGCLAMNCPHPSCRAAVGWDMIDLLASEKEKKKYYGLLMMSYIERNMMIKWCPSPGCEHAVDLSDSQNFDVSCLCSHYFCWNCSQDAHRPVDCETVATWMEEINNSEFKSTNYILAFTKPCPKCKRPIEKDQGCHHMTCKMPCGYEFCWLCLQKWGAHDRNRCSTDEQHEKSEMRGKANKHIIHYYERWVTNINSRKKALVELEKVRREKIGKLRHIQDEPDKAQLQFLIDAWLQIAECRRVLCWTYVYGYYLPEEETAKQQLFEYLQGQAESGLERLHHSAEKELEPFLKAPSDQFGDFRTKLSNLTEVTKNYFENLVTALENDLSEVTVTSIPLSKKTKAEDEGSTVVEAAEEWWACRDCSYINESSALKCQICERGGSWSCDQCTFSNGRSDAWCEMCLDGRPY